MTTNCLNCVHSIHKADDLACGDPTKRIFNAYGNSVNSMQPVLSSHVCSNWSRKDRVTKFPAMAHQEL